MASLRKASAYSKKKVRPYTRKSKNKSKSYIKQVPQNKIVKYNLGNKTAYNMGKFKHVLKFISMENVQIRDNALEAGRLIINKILERKIPNQFYFERDRKMRSGLLQLPQKITLGAEIPCGDSFGIRPPCCGLMVPEYCSHHIWGMSVTEAQNSSKVLEQVRLLYSLLEQTRFSKTA